MMPVPVYPMYSAITTLFKGVYVPYYLDEDKGWALDVSSN
jgi:aspartate/methionine/tyrosine aminotransferase